MYSNAERVDDLVRGTVRPLRLFPDAILKRACMDVNVFDKELEQLLNDLIETMISLPRCVGLAAPQIGESKRVVVVDVSRNPRVVERHHGLICMVNPRISFSAGSMITREGCASVPEFTANVRRSQHVVASYCDAFGVEQVLEASGFEAVAVQHEIDHLDGTLFVDRVSVSDVFRRKTK